ncbi:hypothetical protein ACX6XY_11855 [Streptomyces sp. O3]
MAPQTSHEFFAHFEQCLESSFADAIESAGYGDSTVDVIQISGSSESPTYHVTAKGIGQVSEQPLGYVRVSTDDNGMPKEAFFIPDQNGPDDPGYDLVKEILVPLSAGYVIGGGQISGLLTGIALTVLYQPHTPYPEPRGEDLGELHEEFGHIAGAGPDLLESASEAASDSIPGSGFGEPQIPVCGYGQIPGSGFDDDIDDIPAPRFPHGQ